MPGIRAFGGYVPRFRLGKETEGWGGPIEKAVANFDEDSVTLGVAAAADCLRGIDRREVDALYFATRNPPYTEKQNAAIIAEALDLGSQIFTSDVVGGTRAATIALRSAVDAVESGRAKNALVVAADTHLAAPRSDLERQVGDGAAALLVSQSGVVAEIESHFFLTDNLLEVWKGQGDPFLHTWEDRFVHEEGYERVIAEAVRTFMDKHRASPSQFNRVVFYAMDGRRQAAMARQVGFAPERLQDGFFGRLGNTGVAFVPMLLAAALKAAKPGETILTVNYGDGADIASYRVTDAIVAAQKQCHGVAAYLESRAVVPSYEQYARWREVWSADAARRPAPRQPSISAIWRERNENIRLHGGRCTACGSIQYPPQHICAVCKRRDEAEPVRLSDRTGKVFTYSLDYIAGTPDVPLVLAVINFDGGGRMITMMTDREIREVRVEMPVEMSFRKLRTVSGVHNYYWKSAPVRVPASR